MQLVLRIVQYLRELDPSSSNCLTIIADGDMNLEDDLGVAEELHEGIIQLDLVVGAGVKDSKRTLKSCDWLIIIKY